MLINGGAAVSVLAFIGGLAAQSRIKLDQLNMVANSLGWFAGGVAAAAAAMGFAYLTNYLAGKVERSFEKWPQPPYVREGKLRTEAPALESCGSCRNGSDWSGVPRALCLWCARRERRHFKFAVRS